MFKLGTLVLTLNYRRGGLQVANFRHFCTNREIQTAKCNGVVSKLGSKQVLRQIACNLLQPANSSQISNCLITGLYETYSLKQYYKWNAYRTEKKHLFYYRKTNQMLLLREIQLFVVVIIRNPKYILWCFVLLKYTYTSIKPPVPTAVWSKSWVCGRPPAEIVGSNSIGA